MDTTEEARATSATRRKSAALAVLEELGITDPALLAEAELMGSNSGSDNHTRSE
jgi:hypothetical protein